MGRVDLTVGELIAAFYDEAQRVSKDGHEADRLAKASVRDALRRFHARPRRQD